MNSNVKRIEISWLTILLKLQTVEFDIDNADVRKLAGAVHRQRRGAAASVASASARPLRIAVRAETCARTAVFARADRETSSAAHDPSGWAHLRVDTSAFGWTRLPAHSGICIELINAVSRCQKVNYSVLVSGFRVIF